VLCFSYFTDNSNKWYKMLRLVSFLHSCNAASIVAFITYYCYFTLTMKVIETRRVVHHVHPYPHSPANLTKLATVVSKMPSSSTYLCWKALKTYIILPCKKFDYVTNPTHQEIFGHLEATHLQKHPQSAAVFMSQLRWAVIVQTTHRMVDVIHPSFFFK
jgi:hypothetical protein